MKKKFIMFGAVGLAVYGLIALIRWDPNAAATAAGTSANVSVTDGVQYIDLTAKGGYAPRQTIAQANLPTILQVSTNSTYDCSSAINIPDYDVNQYLPAFGTTEFDLGEPTAGTVQGTCAMGMYYFEIDFQES